MIRRIRATPSEGLPGLWKGQLLTTLHNLLSNLLQPQLHSSLLFLSPSPSPTDLQIPLTALPHPTLPLGLQIAAHLLTHLILSPLELIRTRLIVLPASHPTSPGALSLLRQTLAEEGGVSSLYFHPNILIPALLEHTVRPLLTLSIPLLLERQLGISPQVSPITYSLCDLSLGLGSLLVLLPIETVRRRLQLQSRAYGGGGKRVKSVVGLREKDYVGVVEAIWRIVTEETGVPRRRNMTEREEGGVFSGIRQLYRGVSHFQSRAGWAADTDGVLAVWDGGSGASDIVRAGYGHCQSRGLGFRWRVERDMRCDGRLPFSSSAFLQ